MSGEDSSSMKQPPPPPPPPPKMDEVSSSSSKNPLPPPPSLPPSMLTTNRTTTTTTNTTTTSTLPPPPTLSNLPLPPPPPLLSTPTKVPLPPPPISTTTTTTTTTTTKPIPPPPPPLPTATTTSVAETKKHETVEQVIPKLASAPNSAPLDIPVAEKKKQQQQQQQQVPPPPVTTVPEEFVPRREWVDVLAFPRQCWIPIWIVATEEAQNLCQSYYGLGTNWHSLWTHLLQTSASGSNSNNSSAQQSNFPFRSIQGRHISFSWKQLASRIHFVNSNHVQPCTDDEAHQLFHTSASTTTTTTTSTNPNSNTSMEEELSQLLSEPPVIHIPYSQQPEDDDDDNITNVGNSNSSKSGKSGRGFVEKAHGWTSTMEGSNWLKRYRLALDASTQYMPHDVLHVPPVIVFVGTAKEGGVSALQELSSQSYFLPPSIQSGEWDYTKIQKEFLLLNESDPHSADANHRMESALLQQMYNIWNASCCNVLTLYSAANCFYTNTPDQMSTEEMTILPTTIESTSTTTTSTRIHKIQMANSDKLAMRRYLTQLISSSVLPSLERRISTLNVAVTNAKKGVKNLLKGFWKSGSSSSSSSHTGSGGGASTASTSYITNANGTRRRIYRYDSIETQTRFLGDTLFLLMDYESALTIYKLVKDDYKHDKQYLPYASIHEMMTLCYYYMGQQQQQRPSYGGSNSSTNATSNTTTTTITNNIYASHILHHLETALYAYTTTNTPVATRCATRLCLVLATMMDQQSALASHSIITTSSSTWSGGFFLTDPLEVADLMASASSHESPLGAAVLLELASHYYYKAKMFRKFAFHMLMAGHMYRSSGQHPHATRCFISSIQYYHHSTILVPAASASNASEGRWKELYHHLVSALAAQLYTTPNQWSHCLPLYKLLLGTLQAGRVSIPSQTKYLTHFQTICNNSTQNNNNVQNNEVTDMTLPTILDASIQIHVQPPDPTTTSGKSLLGIEGPGEEDIWKELMCHTNAERDVANNAGKNNNRNVGGNNNIINFWTQQVLERIDDEQSNAAFVAKYYKQQQQQQQQSFSRSTTTTPTVRAQTEPLVVSFVMKNPLGIPLILRHLQLIATLTTTKNNNNNNNGTTTTTTTTTTNAHPPLSSSSSSSPTQTTAKTWKFYNSNLTYVVADFTTTTTTTTDNGGSKDEDDEDEDDRPLFVVTKQDLTLDANCDKYVVKLGITPLAMGDLEIVGVRYQLLDSVWMHHKFQLLGPYLQDTQYNRANKVRAESMVLKSKIESAMPRLTIDILPNNNTTNNNNNTTVLQGQVSPWILRVTNIGSTTATNLTLKTNVPWIHLPTSTYQNTNDDGATSYCMGPSGTLMSIPLYLFSQSKENQMDPGETIDIPIQVRTFGGGKQDLYMLFRYERKQPQPPSTNNNNNNTNNTNPTPFRWLRKKMTVGIFPSLTVTASLVPSHWEKDHHLLTIKISNLRTDDRRFVSNLSIDLERLYFASRYYKVQPFQGQLGENEVQPSLNTTYGGGGGCGALEIGWQEQVCLHYLVTPLDIPQYTLSDCPVMTTTTTTTTSPPTPTPSTTTTATTAVTNFICLEHSHETFMTVLLEHQKELARLELEKENEGQPRHVAQIRRAKEQQEQELLLEMENNNNKNGMSNTKWYHPTSIDHLCPPNITDSTINVICSWSASSSSQTIPWNNNNNNNNNETTATTTIIHGQHHLRQLTVRPKDSCKGCPLTITASYQQNYTHDFNNHGPLTVPLEINIRNRLMESDVDFEFAVTSQPYEFEFIGVETLRHCLTKGNDLTVPLDVILFTSGIFDLQSLQLTIFTTDGDPVPYVFPLLQWNVKINVHD